MAQFRKLESTKVKGQVRHQSVIRRRGHELSRTFDSKSQAQKWSRAVEVAIDNATSERPFLKEAWLHDSPVQVKSAALEKLFADKEPTPSVHWTLRRALEHYRKTVTVKKKGEIQERNRINLVQRYPLAKTRLNEITSDCLEKFREERLKDGASNITIGKDLFLISSVFRIAALKGMDQRHEVRGWNLTTLANPVKLIALPKPGKPRERRLRVLPGNHGINEEQRIIEQLRAQDHGEEMVDFMMFAVATGMRKGEIKRIMREGIFEEDGVMIAYVPKSKNDDERRVVLNSVALQIALKRVAMIDDSEPLFGLTVNQVDHLWRKARKAVKSEDLRIHDLRHEGLSRMASAGLHLGELQRQSGHRSPKSLARYLNARPGDIAAKLG